MRVKNSYHGVKGRNDNLDNNGQPFSTSLRDNRDNNALRASEERKVKSEKCATPSMVKWIFYFSLFTFHSKRVFPLIR